MATIDASIPLGVRPVELPNPLAQMAQLAQVQGAQQQNALLQMKMDEAVRAREEENALRAGLSAPGADPYQVLLGRGKVKEATEYAKGQREAEKAHLEMVGQKLSLGAQILSTAKDQPTYDQARATAQAQGLDVSSMPATYDPQVVQTRLQQSMTLKDQAEQRWKQVDADLRREGHTLTARGQDMSAQTARRGQDISSSNAAASRAQAERHFQVGQNAPRGQIIETEAGFMLADPRAGTARPVMGEGGQPVKGKAANRQLTEGQGKSTAFAMRAIEAENQLETLGAYNPSLTDRAALAVPFDATRGLASDKAQKYDTAKRNFIASILRKETGAAVTRPEFEMYDKMYFPQVGDNPQQLVDKRRQRGLALEGLMAEAGPGRETVNANVQRRSGTPAPAAADPGIDALLKKYGGK